MSPAQAQLLRDIGGVGDTGYCVESHRQAPAKVLRREKLIEWTATIPRERLTAAGKEALAKLGP